MRSIRGLFRPERYSDRDIHADFRHLFYDSETGQRVLSEILRRGHCFRASAPLNNFELDKTMFADGERNIALGIFLTCNSEPADRPAKANTGAIK